MKIQKEMIGIHIVGFLVGRAEILQWYPFAFAYIMAAYLSGTSSISLYLVVLIGILSTGNGKAGIVYGVAMLIWTLLLHTWNRKQMLYDDVFGLAFGAAILGGMKTVSCLASANRSNWYLGILEGVAVAAFGYLFLHVLQEWKENRYAQLLRDNGLLICASALLTVALLGIPLEIGGVLSVLGMASMYVILYGTYRFGMGIGCLMSAIAGGILAIRMQNPQMIGVSVLMGLLLSILSPIGKAGGVLGAVLSVGILGSWYEPELLEVTCLRGMATGLFLFLITPTAWMPRYKEVEYEDTWEELQDEFEKRSRRKLGYLGNTLTQLSELVEAVGGYEPEPALAEGLHEICYAKQREHQRVMANQLGQIGTLLGKYSQVEERKLKMNPYRKAKLMEEYRKKGLQIKHMVIMTGPGGVYEVYLLAKTKPNRMVTAKEVAGITSKALRRRFEVGDYSKMIVGREYGVICLREEGNFKYMTGVRRIPKEGEVQSGDQFSLTELQDNKVLMLLADGMGSGVAAAEESSLLVETLERLLEAGFERKGAVELVNSLMAVRLEGETFTTMDLCMIDLHTGVGEFLKMGAATTFLKRNGLIETIQSTSLPVGVAEDEIPDTTAKKLFSGDMIIMVSDGILDSILVDEKEEYLKELILKIDTNHPQELANELMERLQSMNHRGLRDDATILAVSLWNR